jgi:photosystem II stability/assembly factor-like uncharacterized protein
LGSLRAYGLALILVLLMLLPAVAGAQTAKEWTSKGPFCALPQRLATGNKGLASPAYLAVGGSLFRSLNGWATWSRVGARLPASYLSAVAVSPQDARLVYFAIWENGGVFRSSDGGETWSRVFRNLPDQLVGDLMVPAGPAGTVFAIASYSGIYRSRDRGETWTDVTPPGERPGNYFQVVAHPLHPERLAAHTTSGLWRSTDGGNTWKSWSAGLPPDSSGGVAGLSGFTFVPGDQDVAFVTALKRLYRSQGGRPWRLVGSVPVIGFTRVSAFTVAPGSPSVLFAGQSEGTSATPGILRSRDGGKTWEPLPLLGEEVLGLSYLPAVARVVALTRSGAFYSSDLGTTWKRTGNGIAASKVQALAAAGSGGKVLIAGLYDCPSGGIARSSDGGKTWQIHETRRPNVQDSSVDVEVFASAPSRPQRVYAGLVDRVLRSDDGGATWTSFPFNDFISGGDPAGMAVHPKDPNLVVAAGTYGLTRSLDGGLNWSSVFHDSAFPDMTAVVFDPGQPQRMLAASVNDGLVRSADAGATWQPVPGAGLVSARVLAIHPRDSNLVLAGSGFEDASLYRSVDGGSNWVPSDIGIEGEIHGLAFSPNGAEVVAAGNRGVFRSTDGGRTWQRMEGAPAGARAVLSQGNGIVYVGNDEGVFSASP